MQHPPNYQTHVRLVHAWQWTGKSDAPDWVLDAKLMREWNGQPVCVHPDGSGCALDIGDWIVRWVGGRLEKFDNQEFRDAFDSYDMHESSCR